MKSPQHLSTVAALAALVVLPCVHAIPFAYNPYMTDECAKSLLTHKSPAFGAVEPDLEEAYTTYVEFTYPVIMDNSQQAPSEQTAQTNCSPVQGARERRLEASNRDLQTIEEAFGSTLEMNIKKLNSSAAYYVMPWPSSYWAYHLDGINYRWSSGPSASEKYATAFGKDPNSFMDKISEHTGISAMKGRKSCSTTEDCESLNDGSKCAVRDGQQQGYCIPTWFGICHAWAPASLLEPEPRCAVEKNGVTFQPLDIKALLTQVYDNSDIGTVTAGVRFRNADSTVTKDQYGRATDNSRRDLGPGFMHVALANIIGRFNSSIVMDVTGGSEVWNQPIYSYQVVNQTEMTPAEAANKYYNQSTYPFNGEAQRIMYTETTLSWMYETLDDGGLVSSGRASKYMERKMYTYLLELDNEYNILGGEWVGGSNDDHPDFLWFPKNRPAMSTVTNVDISYRDVRELLDQATICA
ncbi:hypothetical protein P3T76_005379 [Phytophthora citrophthora]|uniref:Elicitor-like transglutaminase n=1 Tax=Phytophthora citrophthora TaxID=4793 RepID=A0AAD9GTT0_9STRA|nr:hypothetical protein P3T76_005379 [Phytophthora citrophthora]